MFWKFLKPSTELPDLAKSPPGPDKQSFPLDFLQKLIPIGELPLDELRALTGNIRNFSPGQIIFSRGDTTDELVYLFKGNIFLEAANGSGYSVDEGTFKAYYPLMAPHAEPPFTAIAKSATQIAYLPLSALKTYANHSFVNNPLINKAEVPIDLADSQFFNGFCASFQRDELHVPSLPDVAIKLRRALQQDITSSTDAAKIINLDPAIASKLIQVVNSPLYRAVTPISNCQEAINRLGFKITQNIVTSISLHNLFRSNNKLLNQWVQQLWKQSIQIASLSYTLAGLTQTINADEALLAGLTYNIGALPIITYAEKLKHPQYTAEELDRAIQVLQGLVGVFILKQWNFPENLQQIPRQASHWYHDNDLALQMSDIVLLARYHAQLGSSLKEKLPPLHTLPAFQKLGHNTLTPDMSLQALHDAKHKIAEAVNFFRI